MDGSLDGMTNGLLVLGSLSEINLMDKTKQEWFA